MLYSGQGHGGCGAFSGIIRTRKEYTLDVKRCKYLITLAYFLLFIIRPSPHQVCNIVYQDARCQLSAVRETNKSMDRSKACYLTKAQLAFSLLCTRLG